MPEIDDRWVLQPRGDMNVRMETSLEVLAKSLSGASQTTDAPPAVEASTQGTNPAIVRGVIGRGIALVLLGVAFPLIGVMVLLVRLTSRGPGLYRQTRLGKNGQPFVIYKIRTMRDGAERETGATWTTHDDPRVTPVGRYLRRKHLDELPQLFNVITGDMALVGPRPERAELVHMLVTQIPGYLDRLKVLPGIVGLAQINLPPDTCLESVRRKLELDLEYIRTASIRLDLRMLVWAGLRLAGVPFQ